jgi:glycerate dehydrogenase
MNIVVLDGYALNPGDLSWNGLEELGDLRVYDRTSPDLVLERSEDADILLTNKTILTDNHLSRLPRLRYVGVLATGYNVINVQTAKKSGIIVTNIPAYSTDSVAQMTFALILEFCNQVSMHSDSVMRGKWSESTDFTYHLSPLIELSSKTIGIIGFGNIGKKVRKIALSFGMEVIVNERSKKGMSEGEGIKNVGLKELLSASDFVTIHCPLNKDSIGLINRNTLSMMKSSAFLINTSRGPIVSENDLAEALNEGIIAGAGLDVLSVEPPPHDNPLFKARNCIITPHIAWATLEARSRLMEIAVANVSAFISGKNRNVVT